MPAKTEKPAELDATPTTEALADDVAAENLTFEPGTPELLPHLAMPRMRRAKAYGALGAVQAQNEKANPKKADSDDSADAAGEDDPAASNAPVEIDPSEYGERYLILGLIEEYLAVCARDEGAFRKWALEVDDTTLIKTFNCYMKVNQPGEATSSAS
jgi:hypothetical protein